MADESFVEKIKGYSIVSDNHRPVDYFRFAPACFDQNLFRRSLAELPCIDAFKNTIDAINRQFDHRFCNGEDIRCLVYERAAFVDCIIHYAWRRWHWDDDLSLLAVGGYGRGELHPRSDIDILILLDDTVDRRRYQQPIEAFVALLWDIGLHVGHSVRTVAECTAIARDDLTVVTALMECRTLQGSTPLCERLAVGTGPEKMWSNESFFRAKVGEQQQRHTKYNHIEYNLEPNVKNAPGGLRDIQTIQWVAKRFFAVKTLQQLNGRGFFTDDEYAILCYGESFLWRVRYGLHMLAKRPEERLLFDYQRELAALLGYRDNQKRLAVEQFMHRYYQAVLALRELNDVLLQFLDEAILKSDKSNLVTPINERFQLRCGYIEVSHTGVFTETPSSLLEIFVLAGKDPDILGIRASTIRLMRESRSLIDDQFRNSPDNCQLFLELLRSPHNLSTQLKRMKRYGILGAYLPEFGRIIGQMQYDLFHIYTVDDHTLQVIDNMYAFQYPEARQKFPIAADIVNKLAAVELLYIAGLYHDIAKGRGGDHSILGAMDVESFCRRHHFKPRESRLVKWLVENHLSMSAVAQKQDISDPDIIHNFALVVGDQLHLDYLYALTVADMCATNPNIWNSWRDKLLTQLYLDTKRALQRGLENTIDRQQLIEETQQEAMQGLQHQGVDEKTVLRLWQTVGDDYFLRENAVDIVWHTEAIVDHGDAQAPLILAKEGVHRAGGRAMQIFIRIHAEQNVFAAAVSALDQLCLNIQDARIYSTVDNYTMDTFYVLSDTGMATDKNASYIDTVKQTLIDELSLRDNYGDIIRHHRHVRRQLKHFTAPTRTCLDNTISNDYTVLEVISPDRPGLLALIGRIFVEFDIQLANAKIATLGERVEDVFYITDAQGRCLSDPQLCQTLERKIRHQLDISSSCQ